MYDRQRRQRAMTVSDTTGTGSCRGKRINLRLFIPMRPPCIRSTHFAFFQAPVRRQDQSERNLRLRQQARGRRDRVDRRTLIRMMSVRARISGDAGLEGSGEC